MLRIDSAKYLKDYQIEVAFNNNLKGVIDLESVVKTDHRKIFQQLIDKEKFRQIQLKFDTIAWKNGLDLAPEFLCELLKQQTKRG